MPLAATSHHLATCAYYVPRRQVGKLQTGGGREGGDWRVGGTGVEGQEGQGRGQSDPGDLRDHSQPRDPRGEPITPHPRSAELQAGARLSQARSQRQPLEAARVFV